MQDYTVHLDQLFRGPTDLLLQLVKEEEVDVHRVEVAAVCEGFLTHLDQFKKADDLEGAGDFMVMAATLMWHKSNALLPHEDLDIEEELQGKDDLLERLLEYRLFREGALHLGQRKEERAKRLPRLAKDPLTEEKEEEEEGPELPFEDLSAWDLLENYAKILKETLLDRPHSLQNSGKPMREYAEELFDKIKLKRAATFSDLFGEKAPREDAIGYFVALLELVKQGIIGVDQKDTFGSINLVLKNESLASLTDVFVGDQTGEIANG